MSTSRSAKLSCAGSGSDAECAQAPRPGAPAGHGKQDTPRGAAPEMNLAESKEEKRRTLQSTLKRVNSAKAKAWEKRDREIVCLRGEKEKLEQKRKGMVDKHDKLLLKLKQLEEELGGTEAQLRAKDGELRALLVAHEGVASSITGKQAVVDRIFQDSVTVTLPKSFALTLRGGEQRHFVCSRTLEKYDHDPFDEEDAGAAKRCAGTIAAKSVSTYPKCKTGGRLGDPICDQYAAYVQGESAVLCVGDGCNWGARPREAARRATRTFAKSVATRLAGTKNLYDVGNLLLDALSDAHNAISYRKEDILDVGTTTLLGGVVAPVGTASHRAALRRVETGLSIRAASAKAECHAPEEMLYCFLFVTVGDCKAFRFSAHSKHVTDLTVFSRKCGFNASDCNGRIGPYLSHGMPDIGNLALCCVPCSKDDFIILATDGVADNLDPFELGEDPETLSPEFAGLTWEQAAARSPAKLEEERCRYACAKLESIVACAGETPPTPESLCAKLIAYCADVTSSTREYFATNSERLPDDYKTYPGKVDHTTCLVYKV